MVVDGILVGHADLEVARSSFPEKILSFLVSSPSLISCLNEQIQIGFEAWYRLSDRSRRIPRSDTKLLHTLHRMIGLAALDHWYLQD